MKGFKGFPLKGKMARVPVVFFSELLPEIDNLAEMKVTLYLIWRLQIEEKRHYLTENDFRSDRGFMSGLGARDDQRQEALRDGLERATARGTMLRVSLVGKPGRIEHYYFPNSPRGQAAIAGIEKGEWKPDSGETPPAGLHVDRPPLFALYEQNIGPLTPMIADHLRDLEDTYSAGQVEWAMAQAVKANVRKLTYIEGILKRRAEEGGATSAASSEEQHMQSFLSGTMRDKIEY